jgi:hypothetical protein
MDISRPDRPSSLWRDRDWTNRIWYMNQNKTVSSSSQLFSGFHVLLLFMAILRHSQLPPLPRLLDCLYSSAVPYIRADPLPSSGASLCDPRR